VSFQEICVDIANVRPTGEVNKSDLEHMDNTFLKLDRMGIMCNVICINNVV